jgi:NADH:ubiquinone oxidoreductase subunit 6 (subunit J)
MAVFPIVIIAGAVLVTVIVTVLLLSAERKGRK